MNGGENQGNRHFSQRFGTWIVQHAQAVLISSVLICLVLIPLALTSTQHTVPDGWLPDTAKAVQVQQLSAEEFGRSNTTYYILFTDPTGQTSADSKQFVEHVQFAVRPFRAMDGVASVLTWGTTQNEVANNILISDDRQSSLAVITLADAPEGNFGTPEWLRANLAETELQASITGLPVVGEDFRIVGHNDLVRAELIALPITLVLLLFIFRGFVPALVPVLLAAGSMIITLAAMSLLGRVTTVNVFTVNAVTMLGLAVGIDYALIMVSRFREEIGRGSPESALTTTLATAGKTVVTAGSTVAIGLSGLLFFDVPAATTTALLGAMVVLVSVLLALTALPAALILFSTRFVRTDDNPREARVLPRIETVRERHPLATLAICIGLLAALTAPVAGINLVSPGITNLPPNAESRETAESIQGQFPLTSTSPIEIVIQPQRGTMLDANNLTRYQRLNYDISQMEGIHRTESLWAYLPAGFTPSTLAYSYMLEPDLIAASGTFLTRNTALIMVFPDPAMSQENLHDLVSTIRQQFEISPPSGLNVSVGGSIALDIDLMDHIAGRTPIVLAWVITLTAAALFFHLRSVALPIKAIVLNLASMGASFGMLVWIFQEGHFSGLLGADSNGSTVMLIPVMMFCFLFGLGMDFEIIMLSRIRESWLQHGDTTRAVNIGLDRAAGIVTASAVLMLTVFLAFAFSELDVVKALGIGLAIAVAIDATIVRMLLLPATMQLMGRWNWWPTRHRG